MATLLVKLMSGLTSQPTKAAPLLMPFWKYDAPTAISACDCAAANPAASVAITSRNPGLNTKPALLIMGVSFCYVYLESNVTYFTLKARGLPEETRSV